MGDAEVWRRAANTRKFEQKKKTNAHDLVFQFIQILWANSKLVIMMRDATTTYKVQLKAVQQNVGKRNK